jgi:DNA-binding NarL/FixJ family response regulator
MGSQFMASKSRKHRILIVDDHPMMREGIAHTINREPDLIVCAEATTAAEALSMVEAHRPDLVLADLSLPGRDGVELIKDLRAASPDTVVLAISTHDESVFAERVLRAGGRGYIAKQEGGAEMVRAIRVVLSGQVFLSEKLSAHLLQQLYRGNAGTGEDRFGVNQLTDREFEVFQLIGRGLSTQVISERLNVSTKTVDAHRANIKEKLGLQTTAELISFAATWITQSP